VSTQWVKTYQLVMRRRERKYLFSDVPSVTQQKLVARTCKAPTYMVSLAVKPAPYQASPTLMQTRAKVCNLLILGYQIKLQNVHRWYKIGISCLPESCKLLQITNHKLT